MVKIWRAIGFICCTLTAATPAVTPNRAAAHEATDRLQVLAAAGLKQREKRLHLMDLLFPKSRDWIRFDQLSPEPSPEALAAIGIKVAAKEDLKFHQPRLRRMAGRSGLIYSGAAPDREGVISIVWPDYPAGKPRPLPWGLEIARVRFGPDPAFIGWETGCCADTLEAFYRADLIDPDGAEIVRSSKMLEIPDGTVDGRFPLLMKMGGTAYFAPENGTVARKFGEIFDAVSLMAWFDAGGKAWLLIRTSVLDDAAATYSDPNGPPVDLGWIDAADVTRDPQNQSLFDWLDGLKSRVSR